MKKAPGLNESEGQCSKLRKRFLGRVTVKFRKETPSAYNFERPFCGAYFWTGTYN